MILLKILVIVSCLIYLYYRIGIIFKRMIKSKFNDFSTTVIYGIIINFALFELVNLPFILYFKHSTNVMYGMFLIMNLLLILISYIIKPREKYTITKNKNIKEVFENKQNVIFFVLAIAMIIFQICHSAFLFKQDADDAFYISWANEAKSLENLYDTDPSKGLENTNFNNVYKFNTWEIYGGFVARLFNVNVTVLFHTTYPIILIMLAYMAYYLALKKVVKKEHLGFAIFILTIIFLLTGVSAKFKGAFLLGRIYQGKAILANIIIPFIIAKFLDYKNFNKEDYIILTMTYIASLAFTPMTISILSLLYALFIFMILLRRNYREFKKATILIIPIIIIASMYVIFSFMGNQELDGQTSIENFNQIEDFDNFLGEGKTILVLYFISILIILIKGKEEQKNIGFVLPMMMIFLVFNPLLTQIYIKLITKATYWRLYWLVPIEITMAIASTIIYEEITEKKIKYFFSLSIILILIYSGKYMYTETRGFSEFQNFEKIPQYIIDETHFIANNTEQKTKVMAPGEPWESCMMRQYSTKIILLYTRSIYVSKDEKIENFISLYERIYLQPADIYPVGEINQLYEQYDVEWIILPKTKELEQNEELKYKVAIENEKNYILKNK